MNSLYVGNLPFSATEESVTALFSKYGTLKSVKLMRDMDSGQLKGFGFIEYINQADAKKALELDGKDFNGRALKVNEARPKESRGGGGGGNKGHGGHGKNYGHGRNNRW
jgi:RNA recognition motif-containing protein